MSVKRGLSSGTEPSECLSSNGTQRAKGKKLFAERAKPCCYFACKALLLFCRREIRNIKSEVVIFFPAAFLYICIIFFFCANRRSFEFGTGQAIK